MGRKVEITWPSGQVTEAESIVEEPEFGRMPGTPVADNEFELLFEEIKSDGLEWDIPEQKKLG